MPSRRSRNAIATRTGTTLRQAGPEASARFVSPPRCRGGSNRSHLIGAADAAGGAGKRPLPSDDAGGAFARRAPTVSSVRDRHVLARRSDRSFASRIGGQESPTRRVTPEPSSFPVISPMADVEAAVQQSRDGSRQGDEPPTERLASASRPVSAAAARLTRCHRLSIWSGVSSVDGAGNRSGSGAGPGRGSSDDG